MHSVDRDSDSLRAGRSGDLIPKGARFAHVQTGLRAHSASYAMGTGFSLGGKRGVKHQPSSVEVKERIQLYLYVPSGPSWHILGRNLVYTE